MDVSVVICVRNGGEVIGRQLLALDAQQSAPSFEVLVVDNGSTDDTAEVVRRWIQKPAHRHQHARLIDGGRRPSIPHARNCGIRQARGRVVTFCDADDRVDANWVAAMAAGVPEDGIAGGRVLAYSATDEPLPNTFPDGLSGGEYLPFAPCGNSAATADFLHAMGGYDESLPSYGYEDVDLSWRAQLAGYKVVYVPQATIAMTLTPPKRVIRKRYLLAQGRILMASRYPEYDSRPYSVGYCLWQLVGSLGHLAGAAARRNRGIIKAAARQCVHNLGLLTGYLKYHVFGRIPERQLLADTHTEI